MESSTAELTDAGESVEARLSEVESRLDEAEARLQSTASTTQDARGSRSDEVKYPNIHSVILSMHSAAARPICQVESPTSDRAVESPLSEVCVEASVAQPPSRTADAADKELFPPLAASVSALCALSDDGHLLQMLGLDDGSLLSTQQFLHTVKVPPPRMHAHACIRAPGRPGVHVRAWVSMRRRRPRTCSPPTRTARV